MDELLVETRWHEGGYDMTRANLQVKTVQGWVDVYPLVSKNSSVCVQNLPKEQSE